MFNQESQMGTITIASKKRDYELIAKLSIIIQCSVNTGLSSIEIVVELIVWQQHFPAQ